MVEVFLDISDSFRATVCRKVDQAHTNRNVKIRVKVFSQKHSKKFQY